jgi:hypothetical protein
VLRADAREHRLFREAVPVIRNHVEAFAPVLTGTWDAALGRLLVSHGGTLHVVLVGWPVR